MKCVLIFLIVIFISQIGIAYEGHKTIKGKIVAINNQQGVFLLQTDQQIKQYKVGLHTKLVRNGSEVSLAALRPITDRDFQPALVKLNSAGELLEVKVKYKVSPIKIERINRDGLQMKVRLLNSKQILDLYYKGNIDLVRNDQKAKFRDIQVGDQGLIVQGLNDEIVKIQLQHYAL
jgi:hypothetical protein